MATVVAATAVTAVMTVGPSTSAGGIGIGGKGGKFNTGAGGSTVSTGFVPSGSFKSLGGTTKGT